MGLGFIGFRVDRQGFEFKAREVQLLGTQTVEGSGHDLQS